MFLSLENAVENILTINQAVIFFDTCTLLNVVNSSHDKNLPSSYASNFIKLLDGHTICISSQTVYEEWFDNIDNVSKTMSKESHNLVQRVHQFTHTYNSINATDIQFDELHLLESELNIQLQSLSKRFINEAIFLQRTDSHIVRASHRVRAYQAPSKKGKSELKDCEIFESFLELAQSLRNNNFDKDIVFFTANKDDFGTHEKPKTPLDVELSSVNAYLINRINHLLHHLNL